jgi:hypothetical protein
MVRRAISKFFRGLCLICLCILGIAAIVAILQLATCGYGWVSRLIEIVLNLPLLFFYAPVISYARAFSLTVSPPSREFMLLLYLFDVILALALTYPLLILFTRKNGRHSS